MEKTGQSIKKRQTLSDGKPKHMASIDRLSALPDNVICHILSFLPTTKLSVATNILARRWRFLWKYVRYVDFGSNMSNSFPVDIIYRVMLLSRVQDMNTFRLSWMGQRNDYLLDTCITTAIVRNVKKLNVSAPTASKLPRCIFTSETLVDLRLEFCGVVIPRTGTVCLSALKKLCLNSVVYESDKSLPNLLSGCPVLEDLIVDRNVKGDDGDHMVCCSISSPTIKRLVLNSKFHLGNKPYKKVYMLKMNTPALRYLHVQDSISELLRAGDLTSLIQVNFGLRCWMEPHQVPRCLLSHLRSVRIDEFGCTENEFMMVKYVLKNGKVLERREIYSQQHGIDLKEKFEALKRMSLFHRGSDTSELVFH